jgi:hypothetical protein
MRFCSTRYATAEKWNTKPSRNHLEPRPRGRRRLSAAAIGAMHDAQRFQLLHLSEPPPHHVHEFTRPPCPRAIVAILPSVA